MPTAEDQVQFLLTVADDPLPLVYVDHNEELHYVYITNLAETRPHKGRYEPVWQVTMVEAIAGVDAVWADRATVLAAVSVSVYDQFGLWDGNSLWEFAQWS